MKGFIFGKWPREVEEGFVYSVWRWDFFVVGVVTGEYEVGSVKFCQIGFTDSTALPLCLLLSDVCRL